MGTRKSLAATRKVYLIRKLEDLEHKIESGEATVSMYQEYLKMKEKKINFDNHDQESFYSVFGDKQHVERSSRMNKLDEFVDSKRVFKKRNV